MTQNNGHYAVQGHSRSPISISSKLNRKPVCASYVWTHIFRDMADYCCRQGLPLF